MRCRIKCKYIEIEKFALSVRYILWVMCVQNLQVNHEAIPCEGGYQSASLNNTSIPPFTEPDRRLPSSEQTALGP
jgi:hypothetical protein